MSIKVYKKCRKLKVCVSDNSLEKEKNNVNNSSLSWSWFCFRLKFLPGLSWFNLFFLFHIKHIFFIKPQKFGFFFILSSHDTIRIAWIERIVCVSSTFIVGIALWKAYFLRCRVFTWKFKIYWYWSTSFGVIERKRVFRDMRDFILYA